jgi:hypothetical protein
MIPNGYPEVVKWRTEKKTKCQAMEYKKLHRILKIEQHEPNRNKKPTFLYYHKKSPNIANWNKMQRPKDKR